MLQRGRGSSLRWWACRPSPAALVKTALPVARSPHFGITAYAAPWLGRTTIAAELLLGPWLISGWRGRAAAIVALLSFFMFSGVIAQNYAPASSAAVRLFWPGVAKDP